MSGVVFLIITNEVLNDLGLFTLGDFIFCCCGESINNYRVIQVRDERVTHPLFVGPRYDWAPTFVVSDDENNKHQNMGMPTKRRVHSVSRPAYTQVPLCSFRFVYLGSKTVRPFC